MDSWTVKKLHKHAQQDKLTLQNFEHTLKNPGKGFRPNCVCIEDVFFGDSGKGSVTAKFNKILSGRKKMISLRFNGGANAGHETKINGKLMVTHQLPTGVFFENTVAIISRGMLLHPEDLLRELEFVKESFGSKLPGELLIDERVTLVLDTHRALENAFKLKTSGSKGATGKGISPGYASHYERISVTLKDLLSNDWEKIFAKHYKLYESMFKGFKFGYSLKNCKVQYFTETKGLLSKVGDQKTFLKRLEVTRNMIKKYSSPEVFDTLEKAWSDESIPITIEGAQGAGLDPYHGVYPDVTASRPMSRFLNDSTYNVTLPEKILYRFAVMKTTYMSSVGIRKLPNKSDKDEEEWIQNAFDERGRTTGRLRDIYPVSIPIAQYLKKAAGYNFLCATHLDAAKEDSKIRVVAYYVDKETGEPKSYLPYQDYLDTLSPVYVEFDGWDGEKVKNAKTFDEFPRNAQRYLVFLSHAIAPVLFSTYGPELDEFISWNV